jgi:hypothetical protein
VNADEDFARSRGGWLRQIDELDLSGLPERDGFHGFSAFSELDCRVFIQLCSYWLTPNHVHRIAVPQSLTISLGRLELSKGSHTNEFTIVGKNEESDGMTLGIDCVSLVAVKP